MTVTVISMIYSFLCLLAIMCSDMQDISAVAGDRIPALTPKWRGVRKKSGHTGGGNFEKKIF